MYHIFNKSCLADKYSISHLRIYTLYMYTNERKQSEYENVYIYVCVGLGVCITCCLYVYVGTYIML